MSKLSWHFQNRPNDIVDIVNGCPCEWVKVIDPPEGSNPFPNKKIVGRVWIGGDGAEGEYVRRGALGAQAYFDRLRDYYRARPYVYAWEGPNEPQPINDGGFRDLLNLFTVQWADLMRLHGYKSVGLTLNETALKKPEWAAQLAEAAQRCDYLGLHMYAAPRMDSIKHEFEPFIYNRHFLQYRQVYAWWRNMDITPAPLLIGEMGIDGGVIGQSGSGWRTHTTGEVEYVNQLAWADERMCEDSHVVAGFVFTAGANPEFQSFDLIESMSRRMAWHIADHPHEEEPVEPEPTELTEAIRQGVMRVWGMSVTRNDIHIPYHPRYALWQQARVRHIGAPLTDEIEVSHGGKTYTCQGWTIAIIYTEKGRWEPGDIKTLEW